MSAGVFAEQLLNGLTVGVVYVLIAAGLSIVFGVMDVINFAHGEFFALGAYFAFALAGPIGGGGFWVALIAAPLIVGVIGGVVERQLIRKLYGRNPLYHVLLTFGLVLIINDLITTVWGKSSKPFAIPQILNTPIELFGFSYSLYNYAMILFGALLAGGTWAVLNYTRFGMVVRAGAEDREMVRNLGINVDAYYTLTFAFGAALAGAAGVVLGAYQNVTPTMGNGVLIPAFVIVVLGGLGSFRGAVVGGLFVGVVQTLTRTYVPQLGGLIVFLLMIAVLLVKPNGLFGSSQAHGDHGGLALDRERVVSDEWRRRIRYGAFGAFALVPLVAQLVGGGYYVTIAEDMLIWALFALSLDLVLGYAGLVSLGHALFYGVGAYATVLTVSHLSPSIFVAFAVAIALCAVIAWVIGALSMRVSGMFFAMITLAFAQLFYNAVPKIDWIGGSDGLFGAEVFYGIAGIGVYPDDVELALGPLHVSGELLTYYAILLVVVGAYTFARTMMRAPFGSVLQALRESETRTEFVGYDVRTYKRRVFVLSGSLAGLAGSLFAASNGYAAPTFLHWVNSGEVLIMTVLGGMGTLYGPMIGAGVFVGIENILSSYLEQWQMVIGILFVVFVLYIPGGLTSLPHTVQSLGLRTGTAQSLETSDDAEVSQYE